MSRKRLVIFGTTLALALLAIGFSRNFLFFFRDNFSTHLPVKTLAAQTMRQGSIPYWNFAAGGGQPLAGNPNFLTFYPDNVLYLLFDATTAFNLHFILHLFVALLSMTLLLRTLRLSPAAAWCGGAMYLCSGAVVSSTAFYNLVSIAALLPLAFALLYRLLDTPRWNRALALGAVWGLLGLVAEPVMVAATAAASLILAWGRIRRTGFTRWIACAVAALIIASPQLLAFQEIAGGTERALRVYSSGTVLAASLPPWRVLEMIVGPFFGTLLNLTRDGFAHSAPTGNDPTLLLSLFIGPALLLALLDNAGSRRFQLLFFVFAFAALGRFNPIVAWLIETFPALRIGRYPEKLVVSITLFAIVLISQWLDRREVTRRDRIILLLTIALSLLTIVYAATVNMESALRASCGFAAVIFFSLATLRLSGPSRFRFQCLAAIVPLALSAIFVAPIDRRAPYEHPDAALAALRGKRVVQFSYAEASRTGLADEQLVHRLRSRSVEPLSGSRFDIRYVLDRSPEGLYSMLTRIAWERFRSAGTERAVSYARLAGAEFVLSRKREETPHLELVSILSQQSGTLFVHRVISPLPFVQVAQTLHEVRDVGNAVRAIETTPFDPATDALVPRSFARIGDAHAVIAQVRLGEDAITFQSSAAQPTLLVVNQTFFPAWRASSDEGTLPLFPANLDRIGMMIPAGSHTIELRFGSRRSLIRLAWIASTLLLLGAVGLSLRDASRTLSAEST